MSTDARRPDPAPRPPLGSYAAKRCPLRVQLDHLQPDVPRAPTPLDAEARIAAGVDFEEALLTRMFAAASRRRPAAAARWVIAHDDAGLTEAAIDAGAPVIAKARLPIDLDGGRVGRPDLLVRWPVSGPGGYVPVDVKHRSTIGGGRLDAVVSQLAAPDPDAAGPTGDRLRTDSEMRGHLLQLAHYHRMLEHHGWAAPDTAMGGIIGTEELVAWYRLDEPLWQPGPSAPGGAPRQTTLERYDTEIAFRHDMVIAADDGRPLLPPIRCAECPSCPWRWRCDEQLRAGSGDPSLVPGVGYRQWRSLRSARITDRAGVAGLDLPTATLAAAGVDVGRWLALATEVPPDTPLVSLWARAGGQLDRLGTAGLVTAGDLVTTLDPPTAEIDNPGFLPRAIVAARAALHPEPVLRRSDEVPVVERAGVEIDLDMESAAEGAYLWGCLVTDRSGLGLVDDGYHPFVTWQPLDEPEVSRVFVELWRWLTGLVDAATAAGVDVRCYCWHGSAELTQMRRATDDDAQLRAEVEAFAESSRWVDLEAVFNQGWVTGTGSSLKTVAPLAGHRWGVDDPGGAVSQVVHYPRAVDGDLEAQRWLLSYNADDVAATLAIRRWLADDARAAPVVPTTLADWGDAAS